MRPRDGRPVLSFYGFLVGRKRPVESFRFFFVVFFGWEVSWGWVWGVGGFVFLLNKKQCLELGKSGL